MSESPKVFLCHASEDKPLARRLATDLQTSGVDTFFAEWSIAPGESIRQRIDEGLLKCTHFVVLLTEISISKPWVNTEIDAGFARKLEGKAKFIPLRYELPIGRVSPLIQTLLCPEIKNYTEDLKALVGSIYGIAKKPPLGRRPIFSTPSSSASTATGLSIAANNIAEIIVRRSEFGRVEGSGLAVEELLAVTGLADGDFEVAVDELESRSLVKPQRVLGCPPFGYSEIKPTKRAFVKLDRFFMGWDPRADALRLATELLNEGSGQLSAWEAVDKLDWSPRRINPALSYLLQKRAIIEDKTLNASFVTTHIIKNSKTLSFVRSQS